MHGLPCCASVHGAVACCPAGGCYAVNRCARAVTIRCLTIFTIRAVAAGEILPMSHDWLIKNAERGNEDKSFSAHPHIKAGRTETIGDINASGLRLDFNQ